MNLDFPDAVPEIPVSDLMKAAAYYQSNLGFSIDCAAMVVGLWESQKDIAECFSLTTPFERITVMPGRC